jgi:Domain of unknown function (DUF5134)
VHSGSSHASGMSAMSMGSHATGTPAPGAHAAMSMSAGQGATNILPQWLAIIWTLLFVALAVIHLRHVIDTHGQRRWWHSGHVLMAAGMAFMFAPSSIDHFNVPSSFWQLAFANAAGLALAWVIVQVLSGRAVNLLWPLIAVDLGAMVYMWSPNGFVAPITWLLVSYFALQALLWATNTFRSLDREHQIPGITRISVDSSGTATVSAVAAAQPLVCERDLRPTMALMGLGMAYMFAAMQLAM